MYMDRQAACRQKGSEIEPKQNVSHSKLKLPPVKRSLYVLTGATFPSLVIVN
jgi:hypothetical protein